ncbi:hypothetical protein WJX84_009641 [Apatococcus fuscideae]|uniref:F-box domain-containing protein n=1 Tax=Apatococcus fuscideae TaxID=2026836 RepID=A0AAW1S934_9CHLO
MVPSLKRSRVQPRAGMDDLDDGCILKIFSYLSPLPDLFHMSCSCKRFRDLTSDGRLWFSVGTSPLRSMQPAGAHPAGHVVGRGKHVNFANLQEAIAASRPGDTIALEAGQDHIAADVIIPWPLHLVGASARPEDTRIVCPKGATAALDFRASGKVVNLTIQVEMGSCILHQKGRLTVESCILTCKAGGLAHLFHPLVTTAVGSGPTLGSSPLSRTGMPEHSVQTGSIALPRCLEGGQAVASRGVGRLSVVETKIRGAQGASAVRCCGSGSLRAVRTIHLSRDTLFWFQVDSAVPGTQPQSTWPSTRTNHPLPFTPLPPHHVNPASGGEPPQGQTAGGVRGAAGKKFGSLDQKAESWRVSRHHDARPSSAVVTQAS